MQMVRLRMATNEGQCLRQAALEIQKWWLHYQVNEKQAVLPCKEYFNHWLASSYFRENCATQKIPGVVMSALVMR